jgi:hypothetical protein
MIMEDDFNSDAFEGLQDFTDKRNLSLIVEQLNKDLKKKTEKKNKVQGKTPDPP